MSWITLLFQTYNNVVSAPNSPENLLPIAHSTQKAHIEVTISHDGNFITADLVDVSNSMTIIPVSEASASRSGKYPVCHPLCDKMQYVAGDYTLYGGTKGDTFYYQYIEELGKWCHSQYANSKVIAIYEYLKKGTLIRDLVNIDILCVDDRNKLKKDFNTDKKLSAGEQADAFVRFIVQDDDTIGKVWGDKELQNNFINYYLSTRTNTKFCYVTGEDVYCSNNHPSKLRNTGDKAKIISANDTSGLTFKGRFLSSDEVASIGYEVSQKAHNALKWLIQKQGQVFGSKVFLLWGTNNQPVPNITESSLSLFDDEDFSDMLDTGEKFAQIFNLAIAGYKNTITNNSRLAIIELDSATTGRMSINFFREYIGLQGCDLIDNINKWHTECAWLHREVVKKRKGEEDSKGEGNNDNVWKLVEYYGVPSPKLIAQITYGTENKDSKEKNINKKSREQFILNEKLLANTVERLLICIVDGKKLPKDIVTAIVQKCFHPINYSKFYIWEQVLSVTCSIYKKYLKDYYEEDWTMDVMACDNVSYNCGRLLAMAHWAEKCTQDKDEKRPTNAMRYFTRFSHRPCDTWGTITERLQPYLQKLLSSDKTSGLYYYYEEQVKEISVLISVDRFNNEPLDGKMALGFYGQLRECYKPKEEKSVESKNSEEK
ncbi:MAG TPA: type I-C CRISPR-associated protein Cas8c/Csd1 [Clostridiales bacterium]|nr:type I-C CRISPR-associated protein Cas8c/Csd1 [Clostridiales bacterium]